MCTKGEIQQFINNYIQKFVRGDDDKVRPEFKALWVDIDKNALLCIMDKGYIYDHINFMV